MAIKKLLSNISIFSILLTQSCGQDLDIPKGTLDFSFQIESIENESNEDDLPETFSFVISVEDESGVVILDSEKIDVVKSGLDPMSKPISLDIGSYEITKFVIVDSDNNALYATPVDGSEYDYLVDSPLPYHFEIKSNETTNIELQVIDVSSLEAPDLGYPVFTFQLVETTNFLTGIFAFNENSDQLNLVSSKFLVLQDGDTLFDKNIEAETTTIRIKKTGEPILVKVIKEGFESFEQSLTQDELLTFSETPLLINLEPAFDLTNGLLIYYPFNSNAEDGSGNDNHGTVEGAVVSADRDGNDGKAYFFDGIDDFVTFPELSEFSSFPLTFSYLIKFESLNPGVLGTDVTDNIESGVWFSIGVTEATAGKIALNYGNGGAPSAASRKTLVSFAEISTGQWYHIVGTVKSLNELELYIDGAIVEGTTSGTATSYATNGNPGMIGRVWQLNASFHGSIDEFRVYNRVLSEAEILHLAQ